MTQDMDTSLSAQIAALADSAQTRGLDEQARSEALNAARRLVAALESPVERIIQDVVMVCFMSETSIHSPSLQSYDVAFELTNSEFTALPSFDGYSYGCSAGNFYSDQPKARRRRFISGDRRELRCKLGSCW